MIDCSTCSNATRMLRQVLAGLDRVTSPEFVLPLTRVVGAMYNTADTDVLPEIREAMDSIADDLSDLRNEINAFLTTYHGWSPEDYPSLDEMDALTHIRLGGADLEFLKRAARSFGHASGLLSACGSFCTGPGVRFDDFRQALAVTIVGIGQHMQELEIVRPPVLELLNRLWQLREGPPEGPHE
jgi:hypothetical protein